MQSLTSIVGRGDLIRKIKIPRWIIVLATSLAASINLLLNLVVVAIFMVLNHISVTSSLVILPLVLIEIYLFSLGVSLFLSALFVKFRDVSYIWEVGLQAGFYITPVLYPLSRIGSLKIEKLLLLNPLAQAMQDARYLVVTKQTEIIWRLFHGGWYAYIPFVIVLAVLVLGIVYFRNQSRSFAENI